MNQESLPFLRSKISTMKSRPIALIVDFFGTMAFKIADEFKMLKYIFYGCNAWFLAVTIHAATVDKKTIYEHVAHHKPMQILGCRSLCYEDTLPSLMHMNAPSFQGLQRMGTKMTQANGILVNTWADLESSTLAALGDPRLVGRALARDGAGVPVYPIGPLSRQVASLQASGNQVINWLNKQPTESVIYVSFGSGWTLSAQQITELAWGLGLSQQRFIWVLRPPSDNIASGSYFRIGKGKEGDKTTDSLPDGFLNRTQNVGLVVPMWAPQAEILAHPSVGGFLSHCGWNSTLESIMNGIPMITWPLYAEQKMNASLLTDIGVAIRPKAWPSSGVVGRKEIETMVRRMMADKEGREMRKKAKGLKCQGEEALMKGGSSYNALSSVAEECVRHMELKVEDA